VIPLAQGQFFERLAVATALGLAIGLERQWRQRTAGLHTVTLVAIGAALFTATPALLGVTDAMRILGQVVTGVGFLAGGVILREGFNVRGLVTAATLWATAAVGCLAGSGLEFQALVGAVVIFAVNLFGLPLSILITRIPRPSAEHLESKYTLRVSCGESQRIPVRELILREVGATSLTLTSMSTSAPANGSVEVTAEMTRPGRDDACVNRLQTALCGLAGVTSAAWQADEAPI
jgi:putative Mg2+ transporter-C (MgtC) family protein